MADYRAVITISVLFSAEDEQDARHFLNQESRVSMVAVDEFGGEIDSVAVELVSTELAEA